MLRTSLLIIIIVLLVIKVNEIRKKVVSKIKKKYFNEEPEYTDYRKNILSELNKTQRELKKTIKSTEQTHLELATLDKWRKFNKDDFVVTAISGGQYPHMYSKQDIKTIEGCLSNAPKNIKETEESYKKKKSNMSSFSCLLINIKISITKSICDRMSHQFYNVPVNTVIYSYTSPKGRNHYRNKIKIYVQDIKNAIKKLEEKSEYEKSIEYQRNLMTPGLRYNILKRDNYTCQICGATAEKGAKLHVDHIKPISKKGLTKKLTYKLYVKYVT